MWRRRSGGARRDGSGFLAPWALGAVLMLAACGSPTPSGTPTASPEEPGTPVTATPTDGATARPAAIPEDVWSAVLADLATRTDGPVAPTVVTAEAVTWRDGSLGCPEPGMAYTQALVDGYQVVVDVGGQRYDYRVGAGSTVRLCTASSS